MPAAASDIRPETAQSINMTLPPLIANASALFARSVAPEMVTFPAARAMGGSNARIIRRHLIPNTIGTIVVTTSLQIPSAIFTESFLSFLGLGVQAPMPSLGSLASQARGGLQSYPFKMIFPALMICLIVLSFNLLGDGLRDAFDPKLKR